MIKKLFLIILVVGLAVILTAQGALSPKQKTDTTNNITTLPAPTNNTITSDVNDVPTTAMPSTKDMGKDDKPSNKVDINANIELAWGTSQAKAIEKITAEPDFKDDESIWYANQMIIDKSAKVSYFFDKDSLWRKVILFDGNSRIDSKSIKDLLTKKYGEPVKGFRDTWENYDSRIFMFIDRNSIRLVYDDKLNSEKIIKERENRQLKEL